MPENFHCEERGNLICYFRRNNHQCVDYVNYIIHPVDIFLNFFLLLAFSSAKFNPHFLFNHAGNFNTY